MTRSDATPSPGPGGCTTGAGGTARSPAATHRGGRGGVVGTIGAVGGVIGGLIGGGSGVLFVPALDRFTTMSRARVHGTSTIANIGVCVAGAAGYAVGGGVLDLHVGAGLVVGATTGGVIGPRLLARASENLLRVLLIAILVLAAAKLVVDAFATGLLTDAVVPERLIADPWFLHPATTVVGLVIGAWAGAMGVGGGCWRSRRWCCCSGRTCTSRRGRRC